MSIMGLIEAYEKARAAGALLASIRRLDHIGDLAPRTGRRERFPDVVAWLKDAEPRIARMRSQLRRLVRLANAESGTEGIDRLRDLIVMLEDEEKKTTAFWRTNGRVFAEGRKNLRRHEPGALGQFEVLAARFDAAMVPLLEASRDARWQLMCMLAELTKGDEGPAFDDPRSLRRHLIGLADK
jgi:hypothetical protein